MQCKNLKNHISNTFLQKQRIIIIIIIILGDC